MLLDEPTQGMGLEDVDRIRALIKKVAASRTVLMVEHNMSVVASIADTITVLARGATLAEGPYAEVSKNPAVIEAYMGTGAGRAGGGALMAARFLEVSGLHGWYGESHVLHGVDFHVDEGEVVTLLGRNGAGRTSTLRAIMGLIGSRKGSIKVRGTETTAMATHRIARLGIGYCPERGIFSSLSAEENLMLPPALGDGMSVEQIYAMFPNLKERASSQGTRLSGGEQQMLAVARILRTGARLLLLDEISEGLRAGDRAKARRGRHVSARAGLHDRHGRAELPLRGAARRPLPGHGAWPGDPAVHPGRTAGARMERLHEYLGV